ncbi:MAG TPA: hypothetical protein VGR35_08505 [Tepidisphaeraceae bacterium]|nr:hypothetical protein [Tepidisphaeraceae bacterium]
MRNVTRLFCCAALTVGLGAFGFAPRVHAAEFVEGTPYYEDDGLLDITEWFDGNDYNPTDEAWWRWDDETYQAREDVSGDTDSDGWYGYSARDDNDWYYDYYDPTPYTYNDFDNNEQYDFSSRYYDYDNDGIYDAYASYADWDGDGMYEDFDYYSFTDLGTDKQKQQAKSQVSKESRQQTVSGQIQKTKLVKVRGGKQHIVVAIQPQQQQQQQQQQSQQQQGQQGQTIIADLGNADDLKNVNPKLGDKITVKGPRAQVGKQQVILAKSVELNGQTKQINRNPRSMTGQVVSTHKTKVRGKEHLMAMVEAKQQDKTRKIAVDLGPADQLKTDIKKGTSLTFSGFPVKVKDRALVVAQSIQQGDQFVQINRQSRNPGDQAQPAGQQQQRQQQQRQQQQGQQQQGQQQEGQGTQKQQ